MSLPGMRSIFAEPWFSATYPQYTRNPRLAYKPVALQLSPIFRLPSIQSLTGSQGRRHPKRFSPPAFQHAVDGAAEGLSPCQSIRSS